VEEKQYFTKASAPKNEPEVNEIDEQSGLFPQGKNDDSIQVESEEVV
jgi:hypothetical protein